MSFSAKSNPTCLQDLSNAFYWIILLPSDKQNRPKDKYHPSSVFFLKITTRLYNLCLLSINEFLFQHLWGWEDCKCVIKKSMAINSWVCSSWENSGPGAYSSRLSVTFSFEPAMTKTLDNKAAHKRSFRTVGLGELSPSLLQTEITHVSVGFM